MKLHIKTTIKFTCKPKTLKKQVLNELVGPIN